MHRATFKALALLTLLLLPASQARAEAVYNRGSVGDPQTLDPGKMSTAVEADVVLDMFEGLMTYDARSNIIPALAESWSVSPDGLVYTFKLRENIVWSNGEPITANDFVYAWRRILNPETGSPYASAMYVLKNGEEFNKGKAPAEAVGARASDPKTLEVTLKIPAPYFLEMAARHMTLPVPPATIEKYGDEWIKPQNIVVNGPFKLKEFTPHGRIQLVKNPKYREADSVKLDVVNYISIEDRGGALKRFQAGEIDSYNDIPAEQIAYIRQNFSEEFHSGPFLTDYYYVFKVDKKPWDNPKLRRALSLMIDREYLAEKIWGGTMLPAYSMVPPGIPGYTPSEADYKNMPQLDREDEAKKIMIGLGYGPGHPLKLEIRFNTSENHKNTAVAIADMFKPFGIEASLVNSDASSYYSYIQEGGDFDLARAAWRADFKDPQTFLELTVTGDGNNYGKYSNPDYDKLYQQAAAESDPKKRMALLSQAEAIVMRDTPNIPIMFFTSKTLVSKKLKGFETNLLDFHPSRLVSKQ